MPITDIKDANIQEQIDAYVRGKMSSDEEIEFEAKYLDEIEVVKEIERLYALKQGLAFVTGKNNSFKDRVQGVISYFVLPKAAWRAMAAAILLIPIGFLFHTNLSVLSEDKSNIYIIAENNIRSATETIEKVTELQIPNTQKSFLLGFKVPPLENAKSWSLKIFDASEQIILQKDNLHLDDRSDCGQLAICTSMRRKILLDGNYGYILKVEENESFSVEGRFKVIH